MRRHLATTAICAGLVGGTIAGTAGIAAAAPADSCNAYSSTCPSPSVSGLHFTRNPNDGKTKTVPGPQVEGTSASRLPLTGGETALLSGGGVGVIGAGPVMVVPGRRRRSAAHYFSPALPVPPPGSVPPRRSR